MEGQKTLFQEESLPAEDGTWFVLFLPMPAPSGLHQRALSLSLFLEGESRHAVSGLLYLPESESLQVPTLLGRRDLQAGPRIFLATNSRGGMLRAPLVWGQLESRYDGLLAANRNPKYPEDRWMLLSRCRCWVVYQGYSQELRFDCFHTFHMDPEGRGVWRFHVPTGQGEHVRLTVRVEMDKKENSVHLLFFRHPAGSRGGRLPDDRPVRLIVRPDIESRSVHHTTKAYLGPEAAWPRAVTPRPDGFLFVPEPTCHLTVIFSGSRFVPETEWHYMVHRPGEAVRGHDPDSDLYSPGYFRMELQGGAPAVMTAHAGDGHEETLQVADVSAFSEEALYGVPEGVSMEKLLALALDRFVVRRGGLRTVIAGYPWFLDWGRDSLIVVRGLVAAGRLSDARAVLRQFGQYEKAGTLPNMIAGSRVANRDTSDAPLWFFVGCRDMNDREGNLRFIDTRVGRKTVREILFSIAGTYIAGTENGVRMDPETGLIYSPAHFTWMDTNFPAASPREGYPIEIQALWYHALSFLNRIDPGQERGPWRSLGEKVQTAIRERYLLPDDGYLSDCLHTADGAPADGAEADDHLRPNQLLAITLGAVTDGDICRGILDACQTLLVPGAIRSLADRPVRRPLPVVHNGAPLNDPTRPYRGVYAGDEDTMRKPAYHNGTAWAWLMPSFCEAWAATYGPAAAGTAAAWLGSSLRVLSEGCLGQLPEILDGDSPHLQRGCDAQAWSASEWYRVWLKLKKQPD
jgi:predicted glycogen debranching enzyme